MLGGTEPALSAQERQLVSGIDVAPATAPHGAENHVSSSDDAIAKLAPTSRTVTQVVSELEQVRLKVDKARAELTRVEKTTETVQSQAQQDEDILKLKQHVKSRLADAAKSKEVINQRHRQEVADYEEAVAVKLQDAEAEAESLKRDVQAQINHLMHQKDRDASGQTEEVESMFKSTLAHTVAEMELARNQIQNHIHETSEEIEGVLTEEAIDKDQVRQKINELRAEMDFVRNQAAEMIAKSQQRSKEKIIKTRRKGAPKLSSTTWGDPQNITLWVRQKHRLHKQKHFLSKRSWRGSIRLTLTLPTSEEKLHCRRRRLIWR